MQNFYPDSSGCIGEWRGQPVYFAVADKLGRYQPLSEAHTFYFLRAVDQTPTTSGYTAQTTPWFEVTTGTKFTDQTTPWFEVTTGPKFTTQTTPTPGGAMHFTYSTQQRFDGYYGIVHFDGEFLAEIGPYKKAEKAEARARESVRAALAFALENVEV